MVRKQAIQIFKVNMVLICLEKIPWADPEGETRPPSPPLLKNHKNTGFPCNIDPDPLKIIKLPMVGHHRHASEMPFQWRFAGGLMMAHF